MRLPRISILIVDAHEPKVGARCVHNKNYGVQEETKAFQNRRGQTKEKRMKEGRRKEKGKKRKKRKRRNERREETEERKEERRKGRKKN